MPKLAAEQTLTTNDTALPARPTFKNSSADTDTGSRARNPQQQLSKRLQDLENSLIQEISKSRTDNIQFHFAKIDHEVKVIMAEMPSNTQIDREILNLAEVVLKIASNTCLTAEAGGSEFSNQAMAQALSHLISQQRSFDCSAHELAMLDSLEFHLMRILATVNPAARIQQQLVQEESEVDDDAGGGGAELAEEDDKEADAAEAFETETDDELSPSARKKKGKAKAKAKATSRKNRYRKWLARMLRAFRRRNSPLAKMKKKIASSDKDKKLPKKDNQFTKTVRIFGRITNSDSGVGVGGIKIISSSFGDVVTSPDGSYAFENVTYGQNYSLAPLKPGISFSPVSINDIALDSQEHNFKLLP